MFKKRGEPKEEKGFFARHKLAIATCTLMGTIVGAGILGIPYVVAKTGFLYGFILIVVIGLAFLHLNLFLGEIVLRTEGQHQLPGYAGKYLGHWGKKHMTLTMFIGLYGALTAYLIGEGTALQAIFKIGPAWLYTLLFFVIACLIIHQGIKATGKAELYLISILFLVVVVIGFLSFRQINVAHLTTADVTKLFLPYGIILFAFIGSSAIPELQEELGREKAKMKKAILVGSILPIILYVIFTAIVIGIVGVDQFELLQPNQRIATVALSLYAQPLLGTLANVLAVLTMFTSFLSISIALTEIYHFDYNLSRAKAVALVLLPPLLITLLKLTTFISVLGITGAIAGGFDGILIVLMYWRAKQKGDRIPEYSLRPHKILGSLLILMFALGILYEVGFILFN